ncbi:MAG: 16S rRNA (adenine(1518)-N(6)/adenine(1519)-N(6))-dimethyltransferase RsmA [Pseudomonadota bacterium]|jgi:16S rRNA (adenine1518-N6/adenine1519-N6)-dimethyltransferase
MKHVPRRRFGQNFLVDKGVIARIIAAIDPRPGDNLVEIGPGLAALTEPLLARLDHLHVVEIDRDLVARLRERFPSETLIIHGADALRFDFSALGGPLRVVGNLPYNISTPLLFHLASCAGTLRDITVMLQKEVVDRLVAHAGEEAYGRLSVMLQYRFRPEKLFDVPAGAFRPVPQVTSAIVRLVPRPAAELNAQDEKLLAAVVSAAFGQRRKTLRNALAKYLDDGAFAELGIDPGERGERLAPADYVRIANYCAARTA